MGRGGEKGEGMEGEGKVGIAEHLFYSSLQSHSHSKPKNQTLKSNISKTVEGRREVGEVEGEGGKGRGGGEKRGKEGRERVREREGGGEGEVGGIAEHLFQSTITFTLETSKPNLKVKYLKNGGREGGENGRQEKGRGGREEEGREGEERRGRERGRRRGR